MFTPSPGKMAAMNLYELRAYDAVRAEINSVCECLKDTNADLRAVAEFCLSFFPEHKIKIEGGLLALLGHEDDVAVRGTAAISLALLQAPSAGNLEQTEVARYLEACFTDQDTNEASKWSSAIGLAILRMYEPEAINTILQVIADNDHLRILNRDNSKRFPFAYPDLLSLATSVLKVKGSEFPQVTLVTLAKLQSFGGLTKRYLIEPVLETAFDGNPRSDTTPFSELTELQQEALRTLARVFQSRWSLLNFIRVLREWGVPSTKEALDAFINGKELEEKV